MVPAKMGLPEGVASEPYNLRLGSETDIRSTSADVRFAPKDGVIGRRPVDS